MKKYSFKIDKKQCKFTDHIFNAYFKFKSFVPIYGLKKTIKLLSRNFFLIETVYRLEKNLSTPEEKVEPRIPVIIDCYRKGFCIDSWVFRDDLIRIRGDYGLEQCKMRLKDNYLFFCAYSENNLVGFIWCQLPPVSEAGYPLKNYEAYGIDGWVFEEYRGKRIHSILHQAVLSELRRNQPEIKKYIVHVATRNRPSYRGDQRAGLIIVQKELLVKILGFHKKYRLGNNNLPPSPS